MTEPGIRDRGDIRIGKAPTTGSLIVSRNTKVPSGEQKAPPSQRTTPIAGSKKLYNNHRIGIAKSAKESAIAFVTT